MRNGDGMKIDVLGIMRQRIKTLPYLTILAKIALEAGFREVIAFTPRDVNFKQRNVVAYVYREGHWTKERCKFPSIIYDIGYYTNSSPLAARLQARSGVPFVGYSMGSKWMIQRHLMRFSPLRPYLINTHFLRSARSAITLLKAYRKVMIKPWNSFGGKGIVQIESTSDGCIIRRNQKEGKGRSLKQTHRFIQRLLKKGNYIIQPWIDIRSGRGLIADHRVLIQKNEVGEWEIRGIGTRIGRPGNITSNVKSGGQVVPTLSYLKEEFGEKKGEQLFDEIKELAYNIARCLEKSYRKRFVEFGMDIALDRSGRIKIIEVNIKPGRTILRVVSDESIRQATIRSPIYYAKYVLDKKKRG
jgi:glutathione synthase/RimK-type ligase-like ATP-grasp enzyme